MAMNNSTFGKGSVGPTQPYNDSDGTATIKPKPDPQTQAKPIANDPDCGYKIYETHK